MHISLQIIAYSIILFGFGQTVEINSNCCFPHILNYYSNIMCTNKRSFCSDCKEKENAQIINIKLKKRIRMNNCNIKTLMFNFTEFRYTTDLDLRFNYIESLPNNSFKGLTKLTYLLLNNNFISNLDENAFADLESLTLLELSNNRLSYLSKNLFRKLFNLTSISIAYNRLLEIPQDLFRSNRNLQFVSMHNNKGLKSLPPLLFANFPLLEKVYVFNCTLRNLPGDLFENSTELQEIDLSQNELFELTALFDNLRLNNLILSHNKLNLSEVTKLCTLSDFLIKLDLRYNDIDELFYCSRGMKHLSDLNLSGNSITYVKITQYILSLFDSVQVHLEYNQIATVDLPSDVDYNDHHLILHLNGNPLSCNCKNYQLCLRMSRMNNAIEIRPLKLLDFKSDYSQATDCPESCICTFFCPMKEYVVDCSNKSLTSYPDLLKAFDEFEYDSALVNLSENLLTAGPPSSKGYENVSQLDLAHNSIDHLAWIPDNLKMLNLVGNNMTSMDADIITKMDGINVSLHHNPWNCVCSLSRFIKFVKEANIDNKNKITCLQNNTRLILIEISDICSLQTIYYYITFLIVLPMFTFIIYIKYKSIIHFRLRRNHCISEINLGCEVTYDAFISYSHEDEHFVLEELVPKLENTENQYKLCIHQRDWLAGDWIVEQVTKSVKDSRKTVIVLSPSFLDSDWGKLEFDTAYNLDQKEGTSRMIVILYKDIDVNSNIDKDILEYLQKKTYVQWGDKWFWDNLEHALSRN